MGKKKSKIEWEPVPPYLVWNKIHSLRKGLGLTMEVVEAGSGVDRSTLSWAEKGMDEAVSIRNREKLAAYFGVEVPDIFPSLFIGELPYNRPIERNRRPLKKAPAPKPQPPTQPAVDPKEPDSV